MIAITRQPRLLVKMPAGMKQVGLSFQQAPLALNIEPLFKSINVGAGLGAAAGAQWQIVSAAAAGGEVNAWDLCHHLVTQGFGVAGAALPEFAEPDLEQRWIYGTDTQHALALARTCDRPDDPDPDLPIGNGFFWFRDPSHSQLEQARGEVGQPAQRVCIAHFDTGYDPDHITKPQHLRTDLARNFVDANFPNDATDRTSGILTNLGHGTGTLSILAGAQVDGSLLGGAANLDVMPIRVSNSVVLFENSAIAQAFDYVHQLWSSGTRIHVITMSMGGLASQAWAEAVNALYDLGVFIVTAAGNNFGNLPTHNIVFPARFKRVVAACGAMANGQPYADLPLTEMAGNYGPESKMPTALAGFTPNTPWARLGCRADRRSRRARDLGRDAAGRVRRGAVDSEEQGAMGAVLAGLDARGGGAQGVVRFRPSGFRRAERPAGPRGAPSRSGTGPGPGGGGQPAPPAGGLGQFSLPARADWPGSGGA